MHPIRYRIVTKLARKGMAASETLHAEPNTARDAEAFDGFIDVLRASWMETAIPRKKKRQIGLIKAQCKKRGLHDNGLRNVDFAGWLLCYHGDCNSRNRSAVSVECSERATMLFG